MAINVGSALSAQIEEGEAFSRAAPPPRAPEGSGSGAPETLALQYTEQQHAC
jgi:hypothetical protein